jgi:hypothetical protein
MGERQCAAARRLHAGLDQGVAFSARPEQQGPVIQILRAGCDPSAKDGKPDLLGYQVMLYDMVERGLIDALRPSPEKFVDMTYWEKAVCTLN